MISFADPLALLLLIPLIALVVVAQTTSGSNTNGDL